MSGETDLNKLLQNIKPERNPGEYVFCRVDSTLSTNALQPLFMFQEKEGITVLISKQQADAGSLPYSVVMAWITLTVHSSLEAVGLTAAVAKALTKANISCNVVAAFHHDHIFVPVADVDHAMEVLQALATTN